MPVLHINITTSDLEAAIAALQFGGYTTDTSPPAMLARGVVLVAHNPTTGEGYLLTAAEVRLVAHYGTVRVLDPGWEDSRPRPERGNAESRARAYVEAALARAIHEMRATGEGGRNNTLSRLVYGLGRLEVLGLHRELMQREMPEAAVAVGLPLTEAKATLEAAWKRGAANPAELPLEREPQPKPTLSAADAHRQRQRRKLGGRR